MAEKFLTAGQLYHKTFRETMQKFKDKKLHNKEGKLVTSYSEAVMLAQKVAGKVSFYRPPVKGVKKKKKKKKKHPKIHWGNILNTWG